MLTLLPVGIIPELSHNADVDAFAVGSLVFAGASGIRLWLSRTGKPSRSVCDHEGRRRNVYGEDKRSSSASSELNQPDIQRW